MPFFYLNVKRGNDELPNDTDPQEFRDLEAARMEATDSLREIAGHSMMEGKVVDWDGIDITDSTGTILLRVSMDKALKACK